MISDIAYLAYVGLDQFQPVSVDCAAPLAQLILDAAGRGSNPLQFKVEASCRVVDNIVMQDHTFRLVASLESFSVWTF